MNDMPSHGQTTAALDQLGLSATASGYHGLLCGALCVQDASEVDVLHLVEGEMPSTASAEGLSTLLCLRDAAAVALADVNTGFAPLLPEDEKDLAARASALSEWCEGFVYGLAARRRLDFQQYSEEVREVIKDLTEFTRAALHETDDLETEEGAYAELVEYIRVGAQLIFMELHGQPSSEPSDPRTLH